MDKDHFQELFQLQKQQLAELKEATNHLKAIRTHTEPLASTPLLTQRKIYKQEAISLLGISDRSYYRYKHIGLLKPRGIGHDFYYPPDLEEAMEESRKKGKI